VNWRFVLAILRSAATGAGRELWRYKQAHPSSREISSLILNCGNPNCQRSLLQMRKWTYRNATSFSHSSQCLLSLIYKTCHFCMRFFMHNNDYIHLWMRPFRQLYKRKNIIIIDHTCFRKALVFGMVERIRDVPDGFPEAVENISGR
jgi:hypothetical protein